MAVLKRILPGLVLAMAVLSAGQVLADRAPNSQERSRIEASLRNEGFTRWGRIEFDNSVWEVDDATPPTAGSMI